MAHACIHAALGFRTPIPMTVRDVAQVGLAGRIDWGLLREWAERWRLAPVIQHALNLASERFGSRWPSGAAAVLELAPGRRERNALDAYVTDRRGRGGTSLATIRAITGVRAKAAYLRALVLPDAEFLSARTNGSFRRRWTVPLRWIGSTTRSTRSAE